MKKIIITNLSILFIFSNITVTNAVFCGNCYNVGQGIADKLLQIPNKAANIATSLATPVSAKANLSLSIKELALDKIAFSLANSAIASIKGQLASAISEGGIDGGSAFLDNPEQFFKNIASDQESLIKKQLLGTEGGILFSQNKDIFKLFSEGVKDDSASFEKSITSTIGNTICAKLNTELQKAKTLKEDQSTINNLQATYNLSCVSGDKATQYQNQKDCAKDFSCGGFDSILAITQNLGQNTDAGRYETAKAKYDKEVAEKTDTVNKELDRGDGFLNKKKCISFSTEKNSAGEAICLKYEVLSPSIAAANSLQKLITSPIDENLRVDEIGELVSSMASRFLISIISKGINKGVTAIKDGIASEINSTISNPSNPGNTQPSATTTSTSTNNTNADNPPSPDPSLILDSAALKLYREDSYLPLIQSSLDQNTKAKSFVQKELSSYVSVLNSYKQVDACYIEKNRQRILPGSPVPDYPQTIPPQVSSRIIELSSKAINLRNIISQLNSVEEKVNINLVKFKQVNAYNVLEYYREKIDALLSNSVSLSTEWELRDSENTYGLGAEGDNGLYSRLSIESVKTLEDIRTVGFGDNAKTEDISPLAVCNAFDPNPQLKPIENNNGGGNN